ncbi:MAG TPA: hypothetical protein VFM31_07500, partial [Nitrososphaeraceae archaeon]|nr:hypothetical protein [Nitrososphaeraceae archaeon]
SLKEYREEYRLSHKEEMSEYNKTYYLNNKENLEEYKSNWRKNKYQNDPFFKLRRIVSRSINREIKKNGLTKDNNSITNYLLYSIEELKTHLEKQFEPWMNWNNHGVFNKKKYLENDINTWTWHIDHIIPHSLFKYTSMEEQSFKDCWSLSNLRPLKSIDNIKKGNRI